MLHDFEGLDLACGRQVRAETEVDEISTTLGTGQTSVGHFVSDECSLELILLKKFQCFIFGKYKSFEFLIFLYDVHRLFLNLFVIVFIQVLFTSLRVVVEPVV